MKSYKFESANKGEVEICITGKYVDGYKDVDVSVDGETKEFDEIDGGCGVDEIFEWLVEQGVKFESPRSAYFNRYYTASVLIDEEETESGAIAYVAGIPADDKRFEYIAAELGTGAFAHIENGER